MADAVTATTSYGRRVRPVTRFTPATLHMRMPLAITTSDGVEVVGDAPDPTSAAANYALLEAFTRFLETRVVTRNMALLRTLLAEYFCQRATNLRQYIAQGAMQICIVPIALGGHHEQLQPQLQPQPPPSAVARFGACSAAFSYLLTKIQTTNFSRTIRFCFDFCHGRDTALREFTAHGQASCGVVGLLPLAPVHSDDTTTSASATRPKAADVVFANEPPLCMPSAPRSRRLHGHGDTATTKERIQQPSGSDRHSFKSDHAAATATASLAPPPELHRAVMDTYAATPTTKTQLVAAFRKLETSQPWRQVFHTQLPLPLDTSTSPRVAKRLRKFWKNHARAVWERNFWGPLDVTTFAEEFHARGARQRDASRSFVRIMATCFEQFGAAFFHQLDTKPWHPGWWYKAACVDLVALHDRVGLAKCVDYLNTQARERFPNCGKSPLPLEQQNLPIVSPSFWVQTTPSGTRNSKFREMKKQIVEFEETNKPPPKKNKTKQRGSVKRERDSDPQEQQQKERGGAKRVKKEQEPLALPSRPPLFVAPTDSAAAATPTLAASSATMQQLSILELFSKYDQE